jgi:hypothetical protein
MQRSVWAFAVVEMVHLAALAALGGAILLQNLSLLGFGLPAHRVGKAFNRIVDSSLVVIIVSGVALLSEESMKCFHNPAFQVKLILLVIAVAGQYAQRWFVQRRLPAPSAAIADRIVYPWTIRGSAAVLLLVWFGVAFAGRAIGFI